MAQKRITIPSESTPKLKVITPDAQAAGAIHDLEYAARGDALIASGAGESDRDEFLLQDYLPGVSDYQRRINQARVLHKPTEWVRMAYLGITLVGHGLGHISYENDGTELQTVHAMDGPMGTVIRSALVADFLSNFRDGQIVNARIFDGDAETRKLYEGFGFYQRGPVESSRVAGIRVIHMIQEIGGSKV